MFIESDLPKLKGRSARLRKVFSATENLLAFISILALRRPRLVQLHYNGPFSGPLFREAALMLRLARKAGARTLVRQGGPFQFWNTEPGSEVGSEIAHRYLRHIDALIVQCDMWKTAYEQWIHSAGLSAIVASIPNTVDTDVFAPASEVTQQAKRERDEVVLGCVGGPQTRIKGAHVLLDALFKISPRYRPKNLRISVLSDSASFRQSVARQKMTDYFEFLGVVTGAERIKWLQQLDVFILPSMREGFPNVVLEAMACEIPVIASSVGAIPSILRHEENGLIVQRGDADDLSFQMTKLIDSVQLRDRLSRAGKSTILEDYRQDGLWVENLLNVYDRLLGECR